MAIHPEQPARRRTAGTGGCSPRWWPFCWPLPWRPAAAAPDKGSRVEDHRDLQADRATRCTSSFLGAAKASSSGPTPGSQVNLQPITATDSELPHQAAAADALAAHLPDLCTRTPSRSLRHRGRLPAPPGRPAQCLPDWHQFSDTARRREGAGRKTYGGPGLHRHPRHLVQQGDLRQGRLPTDVAAKDLDRRAQRGPYDQGKGARGHSVQRLLGQAVGEAASIQGFEMLLYAQAHSLRPPARKWVRAARGSSSLCSSSRRCSASSSAHTEHGAHRH